MFILEAPDGGRSKVILSDGSIVWLNAGSKLQYANDFNKSNRTVILDGEGYFEVAKQEGNPFVVKTREYNVIVKGTKFNITSYANDHDITTTLMEGVVELHYKGQILSVKPQEVIQLDTRSAQFSHRNDQTDQYKSWIDGDMKYNSITLEELLNRLSRRYNTNIYIESTKYKDRHLSVSLQNEETLEEILQGISKIFPVRIEYKEKDIYVLDNY